jgi:hypothetical protein
VDFDFTVADHAENAVPGVPQRNGPASATISDFGFRISDFGRGSGFRNSQFAIRNSQSDTASVPYAQTADLTKFAPPEPIAPPFTVGEGYQLKYLARADWSEVLVYVRNFAGVRRWEAERYGVQYLRTRRAAPLTIRLNRPESYRATFYDLDARTQRAETWAGGKTLESGETEHDFVIVLRRGT